MFKKAGNWLKTKAGNLTNKVTADKLQQAWTKAGSPTDSGQVAAIMGQAGVPQETIDQVFTNMGLPAGSSTPTQAPAAAPAGPKQGLLGKAAGAVGGAIGNVKGAIAGAKDAFAQGKETGFDASRASQAGDAVGATGEANPYTKGAQEPAEQTPVQGQAAPAGTTRQAGGVTGPVGKTAPGPEPDAPPAEGKPLTNVAGTINNVASGINAATDAIKAGQGAGTSMQSLAQVAEPNKSSVKIKDAQGQEHDYKKVGQQWFDKDNKPVNAAQAAMLDKQAEQQAALGKAKAPAALAGPTGQIPGAKPPAAAKQEPIKLGGQTLDPKDPASKKIIDKVQAQQGDAQQPAQPGATDPRDLNKDGTVDATEKSIARNKAKAGGTPTAAPAPAAPAQSPEEIRKAKQAAAAQTAQAQMATNPAPAQQPAAVWKNNRAPEGTPAGTSPADAAAKANTGNDVMARMAKQLAPATPAGQQMPGYGKVTYNAPTANVPQQPAIQPTTGAKAIPVEKPATAPAPAAQPTASAQADATKPGFLQSKIKGSQVPAAQPAAPAKPGFLQTATDKIAAKAAQPQMASMDFSAMLARKAKIRI